MLKLMEQDAGTLRARAVFILRLTPVEWRALLKDGSFLNEPDNCCRPRQLMGVPVEIIPDHYVALG